MDPHRSVLKATPNRLLTCSCVNKNVLHLVRMQFLVCPNTQSTPRNALGVRWANREATICGLFMRAPISRSSESVHESNVRVLSSWISSSTVKLRLANDTLVVGPLLGDNASTRSVCAPDGDKRACRNAGHVPDSSNLHLNLETLVGCLDRLRRDVRKCGVPSIF